MNFDEIKDLMKQFDESSLSELKYQNDDSAITFKKSDTSHPVYTQPIMVHPQAMAGHMPVTDPAAAMQAGVATASAASTPATTGDASTEDQSSRTDVEIITSPIVGTFYRSPSPDSPPFSQDGDVIEKGKTICIIEAMKVMNELEAEFTMEIVGFKVNNGDMVEYGTPIVEVRRV